MGKIGFLKESVQTEPKFHRFAGNAKQMQTELVSPTDPAPSQEFLVALRTKCLNSVE